MTKPEPPKPAPLPQEWIETCDMLRVNVPFVTEGLGVLPLLSIAQHENAAFTDGRSITVCPSKWEEIRENTKSFGKPWFPTEACGRAVLILHELIHIIGKHLERRGHRDMKRWVKACDIVDNEMVVDILRMPPFNYHGSKLDQLEAAIMAAGCYDKQYHGMTAEQVYDLLKEEDGKDGGDGQQPQQPQPQGDNQNQNQNQPPQPQPGQTPPPPGQEPQDQPSDQPGDGQGGDQGEGSGKGDGQGGSDISDMFGEDFGDNVPQSGIPDDLGELTNNALKDYMERHGKKLHSRDGSFESREMDEACKKPPVSLSEVLRKLHDAVRSSEYAYTKIGKNDMWMQRSGMNLRMPTPGPSPADKLKTLIIAVDASGSMSQEELAVANRIVKDAFKFTNGREVRRIVFTSKVVENVVLKPETPAPIRDTGGTYISSIIDEINEEKLKPSAVILITDADTSEDDKKRFESWKFLSKLRTVIVRNPREDFPGITIHCDTVE